jgi:hypothetical protein
MGDQTNDAANARAANEAGAAEPTPVEEELMAAARRVEEQVERLRNHGGNENEEQERAAPQELFEDYLRTSQEPR